MKLFDDPDQAIRWHAQATSRTETVQAFDPVAIRGNSYALICVHCGTRPYRVLIRRKSGELFALCRRCGRERLKVVVYILRGEAPRSSVRSDDAELVAIADVAQALERAEAKDPAAFLAHRWLVLAGVSMVDLLAKLRDRGHRFTPWTLRRAIRQSRGTLARELFRRELLADPTRWEHAPRGGPATLARRGGT